MLHLNFGFGAQFVSQVNKDWLNGNTLGADSLFSSLPLGGFREEHKNMASKCIVVFEYWAQVLRVMSYVFYVGFKTSAYPNY